MPAPTKVVLMDVTGLYLFLGFASFPSTDSPCEDYGVPGGVGGHRSHGIGVVPRRCAVGRCRRSGWQHRGREISSLLILIACDGREIYGSELQFVRGSNTPY